MIAQHSSSHIEGNMGVHTGYTRDDEWLPPDRNIVLFESISKEVYDKQPSELDVHYRAKLGELTSKAILMTIADRDFRRQHDDAVTRRLGVDEHKFTDDIDKAVELRLRLMYAAWRNATDSNNQSYIDGLRIELAHIELSGVEVLPNEALSELRKVATRALDSPHLPDGVEPTQGLLPYTKVSPLTDGSDGLWVPREKEPYMDLEDTDIALYLRHKGWAMPVADGHTLSAGAVDTAFNQVDMERSGPKYFSAKDTLIGPTSVALVAMIKQLRQRN